MWRKPDPARVYSASSTEQTKLLTEFAKNAFQKLTASTATAKAGGEETLRHPSLSITDLENGPNKAQFQVLFNHKISEKFSFSIIRYTDGSEAEDKAEIVIFSERNSALAFCLLVCCCNFSSSHGTKDLARPSCYGTGRRLSYALLDSK